MTYPT